MAYPANQIMYLHSHLFLVPRPHRLKGQAVPGKGNETDSSSCQALSVKRDRSLFLMSSGVPFILKTRITDDCLFTFWVSFDSFAKSLASAIF